MIWLAAVTIGLLIYVVVLVERMTQKVAEMKQRQDELADSVVAALERLDAEITERWRPLQDVDWSTFRDHPRD